VFAGILNVDKGITVFTSAKFCYFGLGKLNLEYFTQKIFPLNIVKIPSIEFLTKTKCGRNFI